MAKKYKLNELSKELEIDCKELSEYLKEKLDVDKKPSSALSDDELDFCFNYFITKYELDSFDKYFNNNEKEAEEKVVEEKKEEKASEKPKSKKEASNKEEKANKDEKKEVVENSETSVKTEEIKASENNAKENSSNKKKNNEKQKAVKREKREKFVLDSVTSSTTESQDFKRHQNINLDTKTHTVNIDKYNEKYDRLASDKFSEKRQESDQKKQKLVQKSQASKNKKQKKETEAERLKRIEKERKEKQMTVLIPDSITVAELALRLKATVAEVIKKLMMNGVMAAQNDVIDFDTASLIAMEFHAKVEKEVVLTIEERIIDDSEDDEDKLVARAPIVVVMGHVDHGKTSLLDAIRNTRVTKGEAGGITQHIGAYRAKIAGSDKIGQDDRYITFLDTPGHEAFTTMRARGASITDIAILVVAADDGIMPQTVEAINHARAAELSIIVAINKMDKIEANPDRIKEQLTQHNIVPEEWGGDVPCIPISALTGQGLDDLLEMVCLVSDMKELKANPDRAAKGTVVEASLDKGRGPIATVLVQNGTLKTGDIIVAGTAVGRVRAMINDQGERVQEALPSTPVEITGLSDVPLGGDSFDVVKDERLARELVESRKMHKKEEKFASQSKVTLDNLFSTIAEGAKKTLKVIIKADATGSYEAIKQSLEKLSNEEVTVSAIHTGVGAVTESDVMLADASNAIIVGFNVRPEPAAEDAARRSETDIRLYRVIYDCIEEIEKAMKGLMAPKYKEVLYGKAECREVFNLTNVGFVAGSYVISGKVVRNSLVRIVRDGIIVADDKIDSLRRIKDDVKEVAEGYECGIHLEKFSDLKQGDIIESYIQEQINI